MSAIHMHPAGNVLGDFTLCRWPRKIAYPSRADARRAAKSQAGDGIRGTVAYQCPAGHWHTGHPYQQRKSA